MNSILTDKNKNKRKKKNFCGIEQEWTTTIIIIIITTIMIVNKRIKIRRQTLWNRSFLCERRTYHHLNVNLSQLILKLKIVITVGLVHARWRHKITPVAIAYWNMFEISKNYGLYLAMHCNYASHNNIPNFLKSTIIHRTGIS